MGWWVWMMNWEGSGRRQAWWTIKCGTSDARLEAEFYVWQSLIHSKCANHLTRSQIPLTVRVICDTGVWILSLWWEARYADCVDTGEHTRSKEIFWRNVPRQIWVDKLWYLKQDVCGVVNHLLHSLGLLISYDS